MKPLTMPVPVSARILGISERSFRRQAEPGGDLADVVLRIGGRVVVKVAAFEALLGAEIPEVVITGVITDPEQGSEPARLGVISSRPAGDPESPVTGSGAA
ncbi:hypothetical protein [Marmoricola sp. RAF53]|uniref:hypothetical protein n=1 Tax=Marmoricola sp. RAF53 TaxID=3233059 RepID=UPI003F9D955B